jgi:predicted amidohydrolase YtcJ
MPHQQETTFVNGNFITLDPKLPRARSMTVQNGRITRLTNGEPASAGGSAPENSIIDLQGKTVVPGFIDAHIHLYSFGVHLLRTADLVGSASIDDMLGRLSQLASRTTGWIQGWGFDQSKMRDARFPTRDDLDRLPRDRPMIVSRICGHAVVVNSAALALVSESERRAGDEEAGLYTEDNSAPFYRLIPPLDETEAEEAVLAAARVALRSGITSVQTLLDTPDQMRAYARLRRKGKLPIRVVGMPPYDSIEQLHAHGINSTFGDDMLRFGAAKIFSDGSLGAQTALLAEPYSDKRDTRGIRIHDPNKLKEMARDAQDKGFQLAIHAIGDQAVRETIDAIEFALDGESNAQHRHRIEHVSMCPPDCLARMARLGIVAVVQPQFVTSDTWTPDRIGRDRAACAYNFRSLLRAGVPLALSSDCPVEKLDAFACIHSAVHRHAWSPQESLSIEESLRAYCGGGAFAAHRESDLGSLEVGKLADFAVLSRDPRKLCTIGALRAEQVHVAGKLVEIP